MPSKLKVLTVEEVDRLLMQTPKSRAVAVVPASLEKKSKAQLTTILVKICGIISFAIPVLQFARMALFFKPKWQKVIDDVISISSMACGTT